MDVLNLCKHLTFVGMLLFKAHIRKQYDEWMTSGRETMTAAGNPPPSTEDVVEWIVDAWGAIPAETMAKSLKSCGVTNKTDGSEDDLHEGGQRCCSPHHRSEKRKDGPEIVITGIYSDKSDVEVVNEESAQDDDNSVASSTDTEDDTNGGEAESAASSRVFSTHRTGILFIAQ